MVSVASPGFRVACRAGATCLLALTLHGGGSASAAGATEPASAATAPAGAAARLDAVMRYAQNPVQNRRAVLELARGGTAGLPAPVLLAVADAHLRDGQPRTAARLLRDVIAADAGPQWTASAELGLGWIALTAGDVAGARSHYERLAAGTWGAGVAGAALGLLEAADGNVQEATRRLDEVADGPDATTELRMVARFGVAYASYWAGDYERAAAVFRSTTQDFPTGPLVDDGFYGAAWSLLRAGHYPEAVETLRALAPGEGLGHDSGRAKDALLDLRPREIFRTSLRRYRDVPIDHPEDQLLALLDMDAPALARTALARLGEPLEEGIPAPAATTRLARRLRRVARPRPVAPHDAPPAAATSREYLPVHPPPARARAGDPPPPSRYGIRLLGVASVVLLLVGSWLWRARTGRAVRR